MYTVEPTGSDETSNTPAGCEFGPVCPTVVQVPGIGVNAGPDPQFVEV